MRRSSWAEWMFLECCGNYCWFTFVLWGGFCLVLFQSFVICHFLFCWSHLSATPRDYRQCRGGSRGRVQGVRTPLPPPPPEMTRGFLIQLVFCQKKTMWFIGVEVEQETSAPPPKKNPGSAPVSNKRFEHITVN